MDDEHDDMSTPDTDRHLRAASSAAVPENGESCELWLGPERVVSNLQMASGHFSRMRGLLGRSKLDRDEGMWIKPCTSIHMFFMRFPIDVVFIDKELQVVRVHEHVKPWRMARGGKHAHSVLELPSGLASFYKIRVGDRLSLTAE